MSDVPERLAVAPGEDLAVDGASQAEEEGDQQKVEDRQSEALSRE